MHATDQSDASKAGIEGSDILASGLRMLCGLAQRTPIDLSDFAEMNALSSCDAALFMTAFEHCGYVYRLPSSGQYELTPQALSIVSNIGQPGALKTPTLQ